MFALPYMCKVFAKNDKREIGGKQSQFFYPIKDLPRHVGEKITKIQKHINIQ